MAISYRQWFHYGNGIATLGSQRQSGPQPELCTALVRALDPRQNGECIDRRAA